jgi:hypothetical protein
MTHSQRDRFLKRLSTVGTGLREDIQLKLGTIVVDLRELVIEGTLPDHEVAAAVALHDRAEALWQETLRSNPPLSPDELVARVQELRDACDGPVAGFRLRLDDVREKAETLRQTKKQR